MYEKPDMFDLQSMFPEPDSIFQKIKMGFRHQTAELGGGHTVGIR